MFWTDLNRRLWKQHTTAAVTSLPTPWCNLLLCLFLWLNKTIVVISTLFTSLQNLRSLKNKQTNISLWTQGLTQCPEGILRWRQLKEGNAPLAIWLLRELLCYRGQRPLALQIPVARVHFSPHEGRRKEGEMKKANKQANENHQLAFSLSCKWFLAHHDRFSCVIAKSSYFMY